MIDPPASKVAFEQFASFGGLPCQHAFVQRVAGVDVSTDRAQALARLDRFHRQAALDLELGERPLVTAEQVHGNHVAPLLSGETFPAMPIAGVDGMVTNRTDVCLGIYVADCAAIYLLDPVRRVVGLVHSGRKGTELGIATFAIRAMADRFGSAPKDIIAQISPCIRPPWYEIDFAATIVEQCRSAGLTSVYDCDTCTAAAPDTYYSYRREKGSTGRMLALLGLV